MLGSQFIVQGWRMKKQTEEKSQFYHRYIHMADSDMQRALTPIKLLKEPISEGLTTPLRVHNCGWLGTQPPELVFTPVIHQMPGQ